MRRVLPTHPGMYYPTHPGVYPTYPPWYTLYTPWVHPASSVRQLVLVLRQHSVW